MKYRVVPNQIKNGKGLVYAKVLRNSREVGEVIKTDIDNITKFFTIFYEEKYGASFNKAGQKAYRKGALDSRRPIPLVDNDYTDWYMKHLLYETLFVTKWWSKIEYVLSGKAFGIDYKEE